MENLISEKKPKPILTDILRTSQAGKSVYQSFGEYGMFPQPQHFYSYKGTHTLYQRGSLAYVSGSSSINGANQDF